MTVIDNVFRFLIPFSAGGLLAQMGIYMGAKLERKKHILKETSIKLIEMLQKAESEKWKHSQIDFPHLLTFQCTVCKKQRGYDFIKTAKFMSEDKLVRMNFNYCSDNPSCEEKAKSLGSVGAVHFDLLDETNPGI